MADWSEAAGWYRHESRRVYKAGTLTSTNCLNNCQVNFQKGSTQS